MRDIKKQVLNRTGFQLGLVALALILLFVYAVTSHLVKSPSEGFSREKVIASVTSGYINQIHGHIHTQKLSEDKALIIAVDGDNLRLITLDRVGQVLDDRLLAINLSEAREMSSFLVNEDVLTIYYSIYDLFRLDINLSDGSFSENMVVENCRGFIQEEGRLVYETDQGIFGYDGESYLLTDEALSTYSATYSENGVYLIGAFIHDYKFDYRLLRFDDKYQLVSDKMLKEFTKDTYMRNIEDIMVTSPTAWEGKFKDSQSNELVTVLYQWTDRRFGLDYITIHNYDGHTGELLEEYHHELNVHNSNFKILDIKHGKILMVLMGDFEGQINLMKAWISSDSFESDYLTKTMGLSMYSGYYTLGEDECIVFSDIKSGEKVIQFASTDEELVNETTRLLKVDPLRVLIVTIAIIIVGAFMSFASFGLYVILGSTALIVVLYRILNLWKDRLKDKVIYGIISIGSLIILILKFIFLHYLFVHTTGLFLIDRPIIGNIPGLYAFMVVSSGIAYFITYLYVKRNIDYPSTKVSGYALMIFTEFMQFTLGVYIYISGSTLLYKI